MKIQLLIIISILMTLKNKRMTAQSIINEICSRIENFENNWHFTNNDGWQQVVGKSETTIRWFGHYQGLVDLYEELTDSTWISKPQLTKLH
jgi:hypothetical protein